MIRIASGDAKLFAISLKSLGEILSGPIALPTSNSMIFFRTISVVIWIDSIDVSDRWSNPGRFSSGSIVKTRLQIGFVRYWLLLLSFSRNICHLSFIWSGDSGDSRFRLKFPSEKKPRSFSSQIFFWLRACIMHTVEKEEYQKVGSVFSHLKVLF